MQTPEGKKYRVLITGFHKDPSGHDYSWQAANSLLSMKWPDNIWMDLRDLSFSYQFVKTQIEYFFLAFRPDLLVHLNYDVSNKHISVEKCSFNRPYRQKDLFENLPPNGCAQEDGVGRVETELILEKLCVKGEEYCKARNVASQLKCVVSKYPGESVPGYLYYLTLSYDPSKTLMINIPSKTVYSQREISYALKGIILEALKQR